jgi:lactaldehyde reductase
LAISLLLPHGMAFNADVVGLQYATLASDWKLQTHGISVQEATHLAIQKIQQLSKQFGLPSRLSEVGILKVQIPQIAANAMMDHCHKTNPKPCQESDMLYILEQAF